MNRQFLESEKIKAGALRLGFSACGLAPARPVPIEVCRQYDGYLREHRHATMEYLANYREKRFDPTLLMEGTQTILSVALNYYPEKPLRSESYEFAYYAYGKDYHVVVKKKLNELLLFLKEMAEEKHIQLDGRAFCDTAPVLERFWAWRCGLGWIGKNTQLILPRAGSYFFLGELFLTSEVDKYDEPLPSHCGSCTRCLDACPTNAITGTDSMDARKCLSYLTIENRGEIPSQYIPALGSCVYGCDRCQQACPWNQFATPSEVAEFRPSERFMQMSCEDWHNLSVEDYRELFRGSAVKRSRYEGLVRNIEAVRKTGE